MTREDFIKRLEEVGFKLHSICRRDNGWDTYTAVAFYPVEINKKYNFFQYRGDLYSFDELEQFLIDKGIVEKPFDAHEYLIERGFRQSQGRFVYAKNNYSISIGSVGLCVEQQYNLLYGGSCVWNSHTINGVTKQSCDKAITLIEFLIELEGDNHDA